MGSQGLIYSAGARRSSDLDRGVVIARATPTQHDRRGTYGAEDDQRQRQAQPPDRGATARGGRAARAAASQSVSRGLPIGARPRPWSGLDEDLAALLEREGIEGLDALPGIGPVLAQAIAQMVRTGRWAQLERLRGAVAPEQLFQSIPDSDLAARRLHEHLDVDTLEALELAAHDGRLEEVPGIGPRRAAMLRASLAGMLTRTRPARPMRTLEPGVDLLLDVDREYRRKAERDALPKIAPRRFNSTGDAWLPILHAERGDWRFTALFSNTARAHELGLSRDWVVIYFHQDSGAEGQRTVVTETRGRAAGSRVVRGREAECLALHVKPCRGRSLTFGAGPAFSAPQVKARAITMAARWIPFRERRPSKQIDHVLIAHLSEVLIERADRAK